MLQCQSKKSQESVDQNRSQQIFEFIKNFQFDQAAHQIDSLASPLNRQSLSHELQLNKTGYDHIDDLIKNYSTDKTSFENLIYRLVLSDYLTENNMDSLAFVNLKEAEKLAQNQSYWLNETNFRLAKFFMNRSNKDQGNKEIFQQYLNKLAQEQNAPIDIFNYNYLLLYQAIVNYSNGDLPKDKFPKKLFDVLESQPIKEPYIHGKYYQMKSIYYSLVDSNFVKSRDASTTAEHFYNQSTLGIAKKALASIERNKSHDIFSQGNYALAIQHYLKNLDDLPEDGRFLKIRHHIVSNLATCYDKTGQNEAFKHYLNQANALSKTIDSYKLDKEIYQLNITYNIAAKENEISELSKKNNSLVNRMLLISSIAIMAFAFIFFITSKFVRSQKQQKILETEYFSTVHEKEQLEHELSLIVEKEKQLQKEKKQTLNELHRLKDVVTKEFITLQDKSKVYIEELIYIQSDDHYLKVHLDGKKDNYVRGNLAQLLKELPPNFKRTHRSYIVNSNFIHQINTKQITLLDGTEIPLSRTYRQQFSA